MSQGAPTLGTNGALLDQPRRCTLIHSFAMSKYSPVWNQRSTGVHGVESMAAQSSLGKLVAGSAFTRIGGTWWPRLVQFG
jgi:hypothetical protein